MPQRIEFESRDVDNFFNKSGAAMNHSRSSTPRCRTPTGTTMGSLHIDLYNMEDPKFENSKYVLTSPRSLEACAHLNMKPVELLYKPLIDFQEELVPEGYSIRAIYETYDQHERERQNKLQLCREERSQIADEDNRLGRPCSAPVITKSKSPIRDRTVTLVSKSSTREQPIESSVTPGSLQRARTAWNTSIGHTRVTQEELKERAEELNAKNQQLKKSHPKISKKSFKPPIKKSVKVVATKQTLTPRLNWGKQNSFPDKKFDS
ncbi:hypothetical protein CAPTEDRAFT_214163 [Capitella teleta]|uniref:Uncharacterized protein n=1 Tax=Capitella teleta TaxID=283909 RepID=R7TT63_CAPTE|nr:hypothetical protein CAPTEDRAFT_214163 [Capitella teleta]|eukprot:ELT94220.1 hypothetical protein CAPTEDRAFT_214163 [Capitella teleta]